MVMTGKIETIHVAAPQRACQPTTPRFYDLLIRDDPQLDQQMVAEERHVETIQTLLTVAIIGTALYGTAVGLTAQFFGRGGTIGAWLGSLPLVTLPIALTGGFLLALVVCLPSFYFYTQLSGLDASFRLITAQALRVQARTSVLLLGVLPVYTAVVLAAFLLDLQRTEALIILGLVLPFVVGLAGVASLYRSFQRLSDLLPVAHTRRQGFLLRMVAAWSVAYTLVCPVALYWISTSLATFF